MVIKVVNCPFWGLNWASSYHSIQSQCTAFKWEDLLDR